MAAAADIHAQIAVIGVGCRLPGGASSLDKLDDLLRSGGSGWAEIPGGRWNRDAFYNPNPEARESLVARAGYFLREDISKFDARFFQVPPLEAQGMDPQQRILLQTTYEALENAGITLDEVRGSDTSVFVSIFARDYDRMGYKDLPQISKSHLTGTGEAILSNRISYVFDLKGASLTLDTGCSGSLVALHQACQNLRLGESGMAIVGGAQLLIHPDQSVNMSTVGMVNPDGRCYVFDTRGSGYARGEGVATVILKRLDRALADGNPVHAVIANSGVNQDGKTAGISVPSGEAQAALMRSVYAGACLDPAETPYVEAHGTGTQVGDKEEVSSIFKVFCEDKSRGTDLYIGSIKSNIGHLEASSGIAGLLKSILVLKTGLIPPHLDLEIPKPSLKLDERNIRVAKDPTPLCRNGSPRRVSLNSFGYGGTNCHVILEAPPEILAKGHMNGTLHKAVLFNRTGTDGVAHTNGATTNGITNGNSLTNGGPVEGLNDSDHVTAGHSPQLFVLSAASEKSLHTTIHNLRDWVSTHKPNQEKLTDLAYTLTACRSLLPWRRAIVAGTPGELEKILANEKSCQGTRAASSAIAVAFVFTGQGAQWAGMGRELLQHSWLFKKSMEKSDEMLRMMGSSWRLIDELSRDDKYSRLGEAEIAQPATTALQIALVDLLGSVGIAPQWVVGHSSGEIGAAYAAGALSHEAAIEVAYQRGIYSTLAKRNNSMLGSMLAVGLGEEEVLPYIAQTTKGLLTVACLNSPRSSTVSGDEAAIDELKGLLDKEQIFARKLKVDTAYHSHHMKKIAGEYLSSLGNIKAGATKPGISFYSTVTGSLKSEGLGPEYWTQNLVSQVRFTDGLLGVRDGIKSSYPTGSSTGQAALLIEIGPHSALAGPAKQTLPLGVEFKYQYLSPLVRKTNAVESALTLLGRLVEFGYPVNLKNVAALSAPPSRHDLEKPRVITDLKPYPWDESSYWHESRLSAAHRFRQFPYHDLCGLLDPMSSAQEPRWRHHLSLDTVPWVKDHVVDGHIVFPGTGYVCMAIEAMRQLVKVRKTPGTIQDYLLSGVVFSKPISFPVQEEDWEIEMQLTMSPSSRGGRWEAFRIYSYSKDGAVWSEHCSGLIAVEMATADKIDEVEGTREQDYITKSHFDALEDIRESATEKIDGDQFYKDLEQTGNHYGPNFALIDGVSIGPRKAWTKLVVPDYKQRMPSSHFMQPHLVHPTTLDAIHQLGPTLFKRHCSTAPVVLGGGTDIVISANINNKPGTEFLVAATLDPEDTRSSTSDAWVFQKSLKEGGGEELVPVMKARSILRAFGRARDGDDAKVPYGTRMAYKMAWEIDEAFLTQAKFHEILDAKAPKPGAIPSGDNADKTPKGVNEIKADSLSTDEDTDVFVRCIEKAASIFLGHALQQIERRKDLEGQVTAPHLKKLLAWIRKYCASAEYCTALGMESQGDDDGLTFEEEALAVKAAEDSGFEGQMLARIGRKLPQILTGRADPLALMLEGNLLYKLYANGLVQANYGQMAEYIRLLTFKRPHMRFLEVGAGTGGATLPLLRALTKEGGEGGECWLDRYDYTDISAGFFEQAKDTFKEWLDYIDFRTLDIERDPAGQGFAEGQYDVVVAVNVLHATKNMDVTMANVRKLMKPEGKLVLIELTRLMATSNLIFGTLSGWWAFEDGRQDCPLMSPGKWDELLRRNAFSGLDIIAQDTKTASARSSMMVSEAIVQSASTTKEPSPPPASFKLLQGWDSLTTEQLTADLQSALQFSGYHSSREDFMHLDHLGIDPGATYVMIDVAEHTLLLSKDPVVFASLKKLFTAGVNILWISMQETDSRVATSLKAMVQGTARVLRRENAGSSRFITFTIEDAVPAGHVSTIGKGLVDSLVRVIGSSFGTEAATGQVEYEYSYCDGAILIPRVQTDTKFLDWVSRSVGGGGSSGSAKVETAAYHQASRPLKLEVATPGLLGSLRFVDDEVPSSPLQPWEIQLSSRAHGVNFKDVFVALGQMQPGVQMVGEVAGVVTAVGSGMADKYKVGDRVAGFGGAAPFASAPRVHGNLAHILPEGMPFAVGATIPAVYATAYFCLVDVARLRKGQSVLVHAASGGVGQAAIQIAQHLGAGTIFATVGSKAKRALVAERYGIPESHIFSTRGTSFRQGIMRLTGGRGVDVVLNSLSGEMLSEGVACVARLGTFVEIGKADIYRSRNLGMAPFDRSIGFAAVDLVALGEEQPDRIHEILGSIMELFEKGALYAMTPINTLLIGNIEDAFRMIATRKHVGKIVLEAEEGATVTATAPKPPAVQLSRDGTYVVAGGLGDLGRRLGVFLASRGAGNIVLLSRRTLDTETRKQLEDEVGRNGGKLHIVKCDITKEEDISTAVDYCKKLPPVRGVIHGGMVLKDRPFTHMDFEDFTAPLGPKVYGTINLDRAFASPDLDFFVMLSSVTTVIGNGSQANYATGNAFQDAFSHTKAEANANTKYISINVGGIEGSESVVTTMQNNKAWLSRTSVILMTFDEFFKTMEYTMSAQAREDGCEQSILGFVRQSMVDADDSVCLSNPLFSQLPYPRQHGGKASSDASEPGDQKFDVQQALKDAKSLDEAEALITKEIRAKCAVFLDRSVEDIPEDQSLANVGLDSLVSIELKNWMIRTFQISLQTSEIAGAANVAALAATVALRSKLISEEARATKSAPKDEDQATTKGATPETTVSTVNNKEHGSPSHGFQCCKAAKSLPKYPLVDLEEVLQDLLQNFSRFASTEAERDAFEKAVLAFSTPGSVGRKLYDQLVERARDPNLDSWIADLHLKGLYLSRRHPIAPWGNFLNTHHDPSDNFSTGAPSHTQAERAALLTKAAFEFLKDVEGGGLEPEWLGMKPICTNSWQWIFNTVREPHVGCDEMRRYPGAYHIAVLRRGRLFKVLLREENEERTDTPYVKLKETFDAILDCVREEGENPASWAGMLTTDDRDSWALNREKLQQLSPANKAYLETIETAAFVVCLDDGSPESREQRVRDAYVGEGFNRWHDKSMQLIVASNGRSAQLFEHSAVDGLTITRLTQRLHEAISSRGVPMPWQNGTQNGAANGHASQGTNGTADVVLDEYKLVTDTTLDTHILKLRQVYHAITSSKKYAYHTTPYLGGSGITDGNGSGKLAGVSAKACVDLAIQLASRLHFGYNPGSWEPVSTQHFHRGRPDIVQVATNAVVHFCDTALAPSAEGEEGEETRRRKREALVAAAREWDGAVRRAAEGKGYLRLLDVLHGMALDIPEADRPALFRNETVFKAFPGLILQTINDGEIADAAIMLMPPESLWMSYCIGDESVSLSIVGAPGSVENFLGCLDKAASIVQSTVEGKD